MRNVHERPTIDVIKMKAKWPMDGFATVLFIVVTNWDGFEWAFFGCIKEK